MKTCSICGGGGKIRRGWCAKHYNRWFRTRNEGKMCSIEGCDKLVKGRGWCEIHYDRWRVHGDPRHPVRQYRSRDEPVDMDHIRRHIVIDEHGCWIWQKGRSDDGYGKIRVDGKDRGVHCVAWELANGPIPEGMVVIHNCGNEIRNKSCCNQEHLKTGTRKDNHNDWDCTGDRHHKAIVPDDIVVDVVKRYRRGETQRALAKELTALGYPTSNATVSDWCRGKVRSG